jgi:acyl-CoA synthetase (AMP-forming)/AMP-acid ligase II
MVHSGPEEGRSSYHKETVTSTNWSKLGAHQSQGQPSGAGGIRRPAARASCDILCRSDWCFTVGTHLTFSRESTANGLYSQDDERPRAYVELKPGKSATAEEIADFVNHKVSRTKRITGGVIFVDSIPKSPSGKILRNVLREMAKKDTRPAKL